MIHLLCLKTWLGRKECVQVTANRQVTTYSWKAFYCELCKAKYQETVTNPCNKAIEIDIFGIDKPDGNYMVVESAL